jgi:hypothetical protein
MTEAGPSRRRVVAGIAGTGFSALAVPGLGLAEAKRSLPEPVQRYYSDYFSFVGRDDKGHVYLAHDNNRGQTGEAFQANHFVAMYDSATGWIELAGNVVYPNPDKILDGLPASQHFAFEGRARTGVVIAGKEGGLRLEVGPLAETLARRNEDGIFWIGSAPATLAWSGRRLEGRVIHEYLQRDTFNYFTAKPDRSFRNFNGLYLMTEDGHDLYMHFHERKGGSDLTGRLVGMASWDGPAPLTGLEFRIVETAAVPWRSYRWPIAWQAGFEHGGRAWELALYTAERKLCGDWETGGFAMSVANGVVSARDGSRRMTVTGWAELLI